MRYFALLLAASVGYCQQFSNGQAARLVIGQRTFTDESPGTLDPDDDTNYETSDRVVGGVSGLAYANNRLFVVDSNRAGATPINHRVLIYNNLSSLVPEPTARFEQNDPRCPACLGPANIVLGQKDFASHIVSKTADGMRLPTAVASDGVKVAVADTDHNRVLIWNNIPDRNTQPADVVIGQVDFTTVKPAATNQTSLRGPQGVWFQNGKLFIADTQNHRVLIYNNVPTSNNAPADIVLGQPDFNTAKEPTAEQIIAGTFNAQQNTLLNPVSVTSDGNRLYVADLGHNRVLIWNSIPTSNQQPADIVLGQPDFTSAAANNVSKVCESNGKDSEDNPTYPGRCARSLNFPRYAYSDGTKLFVADGGNDRVLIWSTIPTENTKAADIVIGQLSMETNTTAGKEGATDTLRTPMSLAYDGTNLYVSDAYNRRVLVFTPGPTNVPYTGVRNAASMTTYALGSVTFSGNVKLDDEITLKIGIGDAYKEYKYKIVQADVDAATAAGDNIAAKYTNLVKAMTDLINAGDSDPNVIASLNYPLAQIILTAKAGGTDGNKVEYSTTLSENAEIVATTGGSTLANGEDATRIAPGTLVTILGQHLSDFTESAPAGATQLPTTLGNTEVYFDGLRAPLLYVSPTQINAQLPWEVQDATSVSAMVRSELSTGVQMSSAIAVPVVPYNPGIFTNNQGNDPKPGIILHGSSYATGTISVDGSLQTGDIATIIIAGSRRYSFTVPEIPTENSPYTLATVRDGLINAINEGNDPDVTASAAGFFNRIRLKAKRPGPDSNGIAMGIETKGKDDSTTATIILSPFNTGLCCANLEGSPVTQDNPAVPGETLIVYANGLGFVQPDPAKYALYTGGAYDGPVENQILGFPDAIAGGKTANTIEARAKQGTIGLFEVILELNSELPTNPVTQLRFSVNSPDTTVSNFFATSNIVTFPLRNPTDLP